MLWNLLIVYFVHFRAINGLFLKRNSIVHYDRIDFSTDPNIVTMNATVEDVLVSSYAKFLVEVQPPIRVLLTLRHSWNGAYVKSFLNIDIEICGFMITSDQNLVLKKIYDFVRSFGKIPNRCPLKRDVYYVKNVGIPSFLIPEVLASDKYRINFQVGSFLNATVYVKLAKKKKTEHFTRTKHI